MFLPVCIQPAIYSTHYTLYLQINVSHTVYTINICTFLGNILYISFSQFNLKPVAALLI